MSDQSAAPSELRKSRWQRIRTRARAAAPFVSGVAATLVALLLFNLLLPPPPPLTARDVQDTVAQTLASATPLPSYASRAYQVIQPSFVLIQTLAPGADGKQENGLGSGVVIDDRGDILTSLHVVADASDIQLTFADGTQSRGMVMVELLLVASGLGRLLLEFSGRMQSDLVFATVLAVIIEALALLAGMQALEKRITRWAPDISIG